ncbi:uncharacterized protein BX664DRAFT_320437 [Halteromyces radiatus]|uniref:uncharacterized protein n=1 Tax=Halteromyces radiatus TaxID=101107 RepID=UPI00221EA401|nr:uncharacterized protein BX664DRAFT_320437 [Halteromyces radiatus]KAI8099114.1 hypothetical protein BX664DRAFT_320437 [Halteromyces radiatus]
MERDTAAHDLAEVRKLIDSMNSLVNQQQQQQQKQQEFERQQELERRQELEKQELEKQELEKPRMQQQQEYPNSSISKPSSSPPTPAFNDTNKLPAFTPDNAAAFLAAMAAAAAAAASNNTSPNTNQTQVPEPPKQQPINNGIVIEVNHLFFNRTLYFQLSLDATIEPLVTWLRLSFNDNSISGMVLQYKGVDGLWKCLLNRDDSLKRVLKQALKTNTTLLQMRVPREQDLLSSGYTDRRLLALTKPSV